MSQFKKRGGYRTVQDLYREELNTGGRSYAFNTKNAVSLILSAVEQNVPITILGDYDADGVCASAILFQAIRSLGVKARVRLPLRFSEGYGMNSTMVDEIDSGLVITVDNGITALKEIRAAKEKGLTVLVTDHHLPGTTESGALAVPEADCVIDPHVEQLTGMPGYDFYDYCGAGVALKLAEKLTDDPHILDRCYALAALATVADIMPMLGENRNIYMRGMAAVAAGETSCGLLNLLELTGISLKDRPAAMAPYNFISQDKVAFKLGPAVNAPSRMIEEAGEYGCSFIKAGGDGAKLSFACLTADKNDLAAKFANLMLGINDLRKKVASELETDAKKEITACGLENHCPIVVYLPEARHGIVGIIAGKICESFARPAIVLARTSDGLCSGSCRSVDGVNIRLLLDQASDLLETYGGHEGAAGLTIREENITAFRERMQTAFEDCYGPFTPAEPAVYYDLEIGAAEIPGVLDYMQSCLTPFGPGNPEPVFLIRNFELVELRNLKGCHLKFSDGQTEAMLFRVDADELMQQYHQGDRLYFLGTLNYNCYRGRATPQINLLAYGKEQDAQ